MGGKGDRPTVENRWWVDQGKDATGRPLERPPAQFGGRFFRTGEGFEQDRAQRRLTDSNLKWLEEANPPADGWAVVRTLPGDQPGGRGVLIDSGSSVRAIITGQKTGERLVEVRLGEESSFDAWVRGEWVREALFPSFGEALRRIPALVREYLETDRGATFL
ncbi:MAG: hypothetical protein E6J75_00720 [Deltaproteobacteria bacterium]|nr:MAG: hypothetical protein E6J75_00720 [Deltaproteobacteria bacterium]